MKKLNSVKSLQTWRKSLKGSLGFIPTMGALHEGHLQLVKKSRAQNKNTLVSIFVNPTQFNNPDDLKKYPRTLENDLKLLKNAGATAVFLPEQKMLYPDAYRYKVVEEKESKILCGAHREGHFNGVLSVVLKLLNLAHAEKAYFGEKDFQQLRLIQGMAEAFFLPTQVIAVPTVREKTGLALSSRNQRLSPEALKKAELISALLKNKKIDLNTFKKELSQAGFDVDYVEDHWNRRFVAAHLEGVRLIDNSRL